MSCCVSRNQKTVYFKHGSPHDTNILAEVALQRAHKVVVFGDAEKDKYGMDMLVTDYDSISIVFSLEKYAAGLGIPFDQINCLVELRHMANLKFLKDVPVSELGSDAQLPDQARAAQMTLSDGKVYVRGMLDALLPQAFYNPHVVAVTRSLICGAVHPAWNDATNSVDANHTYRVELKLFTIPKEMQRRSYRDLHEFAWRRDWLCLGLLRAPNGPLRASTPYIVTNPSPELVVDENDLMYVLYSEAKNAERRAKKAQKPPTASAASGAGAGGGDDGGRASVATLAAAASSEHLDADAAVARSFSTVQHLTSLLQEANLTDDQSHQMTAHVTSARPSGRLISDIALFLPPDLASPTSAVVRKSTPTSASRAPLAEPEAPPVDGTPSRPPAAARPPQPEVELSTLPASAAPGVTAVVFAPPPVVAAPAPHVSWSERTPVSQMVSNQPAVSTAPLRSAMRNNSQTHAALPVPTLSTAVTAPGPSLLPVSSASFPGTFPAGRATSRMLTPVPHPFASALLDDLDEPVLVLNTRGRSSTSSKPLATLPTQPQK